MTQIVQLSGMTCEACEYKIQYVFGQLAGVQSVVAKRLSNEVLIETQEIIASETLKKAIKPYPNYQILETPVSQNIELEKRSNSFKPLLIIAAFITGTAAITAYQSAHQEPLLAFLHNFMTGFFLVFSFFKLLDVKNFANSFAMYDLLAAKVPIYGRIYPFIELALGILCLLHFRVIFVYWADIILMGFGAIGVMESVLNKRKIKCACLGSVFDLPMTSVTIIENGLMVITGILLLILT